jgi:hypothetical protein
MNEIEWMQYGIDKGFVSWFCLQHDTGFNESENEALDNGEDICVDVFRLKSAMDKKWTVF